MIPVKGLEIVGITDVGRTRARNEDAIDWDAEIGLAILADGLGGHNAGDVASALAVASIKAELQQARYQRAGQAPLHGRDGADSDATGDYAALVAESVRHANRALYETVQREPRYAGMGTTVVLALFADHLVTISHVGDSRAYRLRRGQLEQLTVDHSLVQELLRTGYLTEEEARVSEHRNVITRALGIDPEVEPDVEQYRVEPEDIYLLCSDGLSNLLSEESISVGLASAGTDMLQAARELVSMANERGGYDNISVILVRVGS
jgi:PPM family protein phosphatase